MFEDFDRMPTGAATPPRGGEERPRRRRRRRRPEGHDDEPPAVSADGGPGPEERDDTLGRALAYEADDALPTRQARPRRPRWGYRS